jgi:hypothetical protein
MKRITTLLTPSTLLLTVGVPTVLAKGGEGTRIVLKPAKAFPAAKGSAKFKATAEERELQVEVEHVRRLAGKRVNFFVNATKVGSKRVSALGAAQLNRRGSTFPGIKSGTRISVKTAGGKLIVSGRF